MDQFTTTHYILSQNIFMIFNLVASSKVDLNWCLSRLCVCVLSSFDGRSPVEPIAHPNGRLRIEIRLRTNQIDVKYHSECSLEWTHLHTWRWRSNDAFEFCLHERKRKKQKKRKETKNTLNNSDRVSMHSKSIRWNPIQITFLAESRLLMHN